MSARSKARKRALDILFSADLRDQPLGDALAEAERAALAAPERASSWPYARQIAQGVIDHAEQIDETITTYSAGWRLERMPAVDRAVLRLAVWELLYNSEVPQVVTITESAELASRLSTDASASFVTGVLHQIAGGQPEEPSPEP